jgi:oligopeptide transport system substrate-binding protein
MRYMRDSTERRKIINRMKQIFVEDLPWLPGIHRVNYGLSHRWLKNYKPGYMGGNVAKFLRVDDEVKAQGAK